MEKIKIKSEIIFIMLLIIMLAVFSACTKEKNNDESTTQPLTTQVTMQTTTPAVIQSDTVVQATVPVATTAASTTKAVVTTVVPSVSVATTVMQTSTAPVTTEAVSVTNETTTVKQEETTVKNVIGSGYDYLLAELNKELGKKQFCDEANELFYDVLDNLYTNYPSWQQVCRGLPDTDEYIINNFIRAISKIGAVKWYDADSAEAVELINNGSATAWVELGQGRTTLNIISQPSHSASKMVRDEDIELMFHEITHCRMEDFDSDCVYFEGDPLMRFMLDEGAVTFHAKFTTPCNTDAFGAWSVTDKANSINIEYTKLNCVGYLLEMNAYEKLVYLAGYDVIEKVENSQAKFSSIITALSGKYGISKTADFFRTMYAWYKEYNNSYCSDEMYNLAVRFENMFLDLVKADIRDLESGKEATVYKNIYDFYKKRNLPRVTVVATDENITDKIFSIAETDAMLEEKLK